MHTQPPVLTLASVAADPATVTSHLILATGEEIVFCPLAPDDDGALADFLQRLSPQTRRFSTYASYNLAAAQEMCAAINRYDKLRMVATSNQRIVALFEFSFGIVADDIKRYQSYGIALDERTDCRFGPCLADDYQDQGLGSQLLPAMLDIARRFGKQRMILWGGVLADNARAIRYYEKNGFRLLGQFRNDMAEACWDAMRLL